MSDLVGFVAFQISALSHQGTDFLLYYLSGDHIKWRYLIQFTGLLKGLNGVASLSYMRAVKKDSSICYFEHQATGLIY